LARERLRPDDPTRQLDAPRLPRPLPKYLDEAEVDALLEAAARRAGRPGLVVRAALEILYATGLRISELLTLSQAAFAGDAAVLLVRGKGGKERIVPLSDPARDAAASLAVSNPEGARFLFATRAGTRPIKRQAFDRILKATALAAGLDPARVSPH